MEASEGMNSTVTVAGAEAQSDYHGAPRSENPSLFTGLSSPPPLPTVEVSGLGGTSEKKKRGRPRKYAADGTPLSPTPASSSGPRILSSIEKGRGQLSAFKNKLSKMGVEVSGGWASRPISSNFTPHVITVNAGEDVTMKVISFSQQGPRAICVLSANGVISNVTLRQPDSSGGTLTYEGLFEILSLSGAFLPTENQGTRGRSGGLSVALSSPDGRVVGGGVAGLLIAASPVQVVLGSFLPGEQQEHKPRKKKYEYASAAAATGAGTGTGTGTGSGGGSHSDEEDMNHPAVTKQNPVTSSFNRENWGGTMQEPRNGAPTTSTTTDINISLPAV